MAAANDVSQTIMTTHLATTRIPTRIHSSKALLAVSAVTYLALALVVGVHAAFYLVVASVVVALWAAACRRFPVIGYFTYRFFLGFFGGLISGLFGYRDGAYRPYTYRRRRRW
jgi:hypothetical protein